MTNIASHTHTLFDQFPQLVESLASEVGRDGAVRAAERIVEAEYADFHWDGRLAEMNLGAYDCTDDDAEGLERVAIVGYLRGRYYAAVCLVDRDRRVDCMIGIRHADSFDDAVAMFYALAA